MTTFLAQMSFTWLALFPILNPPAIAPVFLNLTSAAAEREGNRLALLIRARIACFLTVLLSLGVGIARDGAGELLLATLDDPALADRLRAFAVGLR